METVEAKSDKICVSIICTCFNHEEYINDSIEGFLNQVVNFNFEIIIHDDLSTDQSRRILESYRSKYPDKIKLLFPEKNQFSEYMCKPIVNCLKIARGEFIALCEGDDYWLYPHKLQEQYDLLVENPSVSLCFSAAIEKNIISGEEKTICCYSTQNNTIDSRELIIGRGGYVPTASIFFRAEHSLFIIENSAIWPIGDFFIQSYLAMEGTVKYIPTATCVYRRCSTNSWTSTQHNRKNLLKYSISMLKSIPLFFNQCNKYSESTSLIYPFLYYAKGAMCNSQGLNERVNAACYILSRFAFFLWLIICDFFKKIFK